MKHQDDYLSNHYDSDPTAFHDAVGGKHKKWKLEIEKLSKNLLNGNLPDGMDMEDYLDVILENVKRTDFPIILDPKSASFDEVAIHGILRQRLSKSTVTKNIRYARFMESHKVSVDFRNPTFENFIKHMDYREQYEFEDGKGYSALDHEWKTMKMFLKSYGMEIWDYKPPGFPLYRAKVVPFPDQVNQFLHLKYSSDKYENALIQYMLTHNFIIGWRIPSEPIMMKTNDVFIDGNDRGFIKITEPKKHHSTRKVTPIEILTSKQKKSFKNWIDNWRPKVECSKSGDALYLKPNGAPFNDKEHLRMYLNRKASPIIKKIFPEYHNYIARDYCAISRLIRSKLETKHFDVYEVKEWLGHTQIQTTMSYIKDAKDYYKIAPFDWINRTLRAKCEDSAKKSIKPKKRAYCNKSLLLEETGLRGFEPLANRLRADCST